MKTSGLAGVLRKALLPESAVRLAFVFGSVASGEENALSDIDLMVIGSLGLRTLVSRLSGVATQLGRELNPHIFSGAEFGRRKKSGDHFLTTVLAAPRLFLIGDEHELEGLG